MPTYDYECETCGPFSESYPMSQYDRPQPCPDCGDLSQRLLTVPAIGCGATEAASPGMQTRAHAGGCACCAAPRQFSAEAV